MLNFIHTITIYVIYVINEFLLLVYSVNLLFCCIIFVNKQKNSQRQQQSTRTADAHLYLLVYLLRMMNQLRFDDASQIHHTDVTLVFCCQ